MTARATSLEFLGDRLQICGRVWLLLDPDKHQVDDVYGYLGDERPLWTAQEAKTVAELLTWAAREGLVEADESPLLSAEGRRFLTKRVEESVEITASRLLVAGEGLRGNLVPSAAQAAVRSILSGELGVKFVPEPEDDLEAMLAGNSVQPEQIVVVLSWRRPAQPRRWAVLRPGMSGLDQLLAYQQTNPAWAEQVEAACLSMED